VNQAQELLVVLRVEADPPAGAIADAVFDQRTGSARAAFLG
jgi:hypothetical protein